MKKNNTYYISERLWKFLFLSLLAVLLSTGASAQWMMVNQGGGSPDASAALEVSSTTRGFLGPRLTQTQINAVTSPATGLLVFNTDSNKFYFYDGGAWLPVSQTDTLSVIEDVDGDTRIVLEQNSDDDTLRLFTNGTQRMVITPVGNVGIGTDTPAYPLQVESSGFVNTNLQSTSGNGTWLNIGNSSPGGIEYKLISSGNTNGEGAGKLLFGVGTVPNGVSNISMILDSNLLGIGTANPGAELEVAGNAIVDSLRVDGAYGLPRVDGASGEYLQTDGAGNVSWSSADTNSVLQDADRDTRIELEQSADDDTVRIYAGGTQWFTMSPAGNIGIRNSDPRQDISIIDTTASILVESTNDPSWAGTRLTTPNSDYSLISGFGSTGGFGIRDQDRNYAPFMIDSSGNVGIGTTSPETDLHLDGRMSLTGIGSGRSIVAHAPVANRNYLWLRADSALASGAGINLYGSDDNLYPDQIRFYTTNDNNDPNMVIDSAGRVAIGPDSALASLHVGDALNFGHGGADLRYFGMNLYADTANSAFRYMNNGSAATLATNLNPAGFTGLFFFRDGTAGTTAAANADTYIRLDSNDVTIDGGASFITTRINTYTEIDSLRINSQYSFPSADGVTGQVLTTTGFGTVNWAYPDTLSTISDADGDTYIEVETTADIDDIRFHANGAQRMQIFNTGAFQFGLGSQPSSYFAEVQTPIGSTFATGLSVDHDYNGAAQVFGVSSNISPASTGQKFGLYSYVAGNASQTNAIYGTQNQVVGGSGEATFGLRNDVSGGTGSKTGVQNDLSGGGGSITGMQNEITQTGNDIVHGVDNNFDVDGTGGVFAIHNSFTGSTGSGNYYGLQNIINVGTGQKYGVRNTISTASGSSPAYGVFSSVTHNGTGLAYGYRATMSGTSGNKYGFYSSGENYNYFEGNVGIGSITNPSDELHIRGSAQVDLRLESTSTSDVILNLENSSTTWKVGNVNGELRIIDGFTNRFTIEGTGEVGIGTFNPSSQLEVVGDVEIPAANDYTYSTAKTHYQSFAPTTFNSLLPDQYDFGTNAAANWYAYFRSGGTAFGYATVEVNLPDGATVTELRGWVYDNLNTNPVRVTLYRQQLGTATIANMAEIESASATATTVVQNLSDNTVLNQVVDNTNYSYFLMFTGRQNSTDSRLYGARITYTVTEAD